MTDQYQVDVVSVDPPKRTAVVPAPKKKTPRRKKN